MSLTVPDKSEPQTDDRSVDSKSFRALGAAERAAVVLASLDEKSLGRLSGRLSLANKTRFGRALEGLTSVGPEEQQAIARAFAHELAERRAGVAGGSALATKLSGRLYDGVEPEPEPEEVEPSPKTFWERVEDLGAKPLAAFLETCPAPAVALALNALPEAFAAEVASAMSEAPSISSVVAMAGSDSANSLAVGAVEDLINANFFGENASGGPIDTARADRIAGLLNRLSTGRRLAVLEQLPAQLDEELLAAVQERVLGFDDLAKRLPRNVVPVIFREADESMLLTALSYAEGRGSQTATYLLANISQRLAAQLRERLPKTVDEEAGEKAQSEVVGFVLTLVSRGDVTLLDRSQP